MSSNEPITVSVGWQIVCIPLIIAGICAIVCFTIDVVEDIRFDIACKKYSTYEMGGGYELRKYYNKPDKIVRKGRLSAVAKDIDWAKGSKEDSLWVVCKDNCCAYFNTRTGDFTSPFKYLNAWPFSEGVAAVVDEHNQLKFIDPHGNLAIDSIFRFDQKLIGSELAFHNGLCKMVDTLGRYGIIDMSGKWVVAPSSDEAFFDPQNWWVLKRNDSLMVVDTCGRTIIEMNRGQELKFLVDGSLEAWHQLYPGRIYDTAGNLIASQSYEEIQSLTYFEDDEEINTGLFVYSTDYNHKGLMTSDGQILTQAKYSDIEVLGKTRFRAELLVYHCDDCFERQSVLLNEKGQIVAE
ncbi:MAG: WG repeat-containing protein [Bacteroidales bacterium]|nr:WG repeat-containing protein [Bacteroidales bacterium]